MTVSFDEMELEECKIIFGKLLKENNEKYKNNLKNFTYLHKKMEDEMKSNKRTIDPIVTLRNLKYICDFWKNNISPKIAAEISYQDFH